MALTGAHVPLPGDNFYVVVVIQQGDLCCYWGLSIGVQVAIGGMDARCQVALTDRPARCRVGSGQVNACDMTAGVR